MARNASGGFAYRSAILSPTAFSQFTMWEVSGKAFRLKADLNAIIQFFT
jgi:hypothetical protein